MCWVCHDSGRGEERRVSGCRVVVGCSWILLNNKTVVDPWSAILCSECRQCVVMFFITTATVHHLDWNELNATLAAGSSQTVPSAGEASGMRFFQTRKVCCVWFCVGKMCKDPTRSTLAAGLKGKFMPRCSLIWCSEPLSNDKTINVRQSMRNYRKDCPKINGHYRSKRWQGILDITL